MKVAVVGSGSVGLRHLTAMRSLEGIEPIAVPSRQSRLAELAAEGFQTAPDVRTAASHGARAAIIATNTSRHAADTAVALAEGLDVLVEKPMAVDAVQARQVRDEGTRAGRRIFVGCVLRFSESLGMFRDRLAQLGRLHTVRIECQSYLPEWRPSRPYQDSYSARAGEGGVLRDLIHEIDYAGWLFGWPQAVQARVKNLGRLGIDAEEVAELMWELPGGALVSMTLDYLSRPTRRYLRASGERGTLEWDGVAGTMTAVLVNAPPQTLRSAQTRDELFLTQDRAVIDACRGTLDPRLAMAEDGVKALAVCEAAQRANACRREEIVEYS